jgi:hypothetical protein
MRLIDWTSVRLSVRTCLSSCMAAAAVWVCVACSDIRSASECNNLPGQRVRTEADYVVNQVPLDEGDSYFLCFPGEQGRTTGPNIGELLFLQTGRIVIVGSSSHYITRASIVLDTHGDTLAVIEHNEVASFGNSSDGRIFWLVEFRVSGDFADGSVTTAVGVLKVFNANGKHLLTRTFNQPGSIDIEPEGRRYTIQVPKPDIPG